MGVLPGELQAFAGNPGWRSAGRTLPGRTAAPARPASRPSPRRPAGFAYRRAPPRARWRPANPTALTPIRASRPNAMACEPGCAVSMAVLPVSGSSSITSSTVRVNGPMVSSVWLSDMTPAPLWRPMLGRMPVGPQNAEGVRIRTAGVVPTAKGTICAPTADPDPLLDPPSRRGVRAQPGCAAFPMRWLVPQPPNANSTVCVLPSRIIPASSSARTYSAVAPACHPRAGARAIGRESAGHVDDILHGERNAMQGLRRCPCASACVAWRAACRASSS